MIRNFILLLCIYPIAVVAVGIVLTIKVLIVEQISFYIAFRKQNKYKIYE